MMLLPQGLWATSRTFLLSICCFSMLFYFTCAPCFLLFSCFLSMSGCTSSAQNKTWTFFIELSNIQHGHIIQWTGVPNPLGSACLSWATFQGSADTLQKYVLDPRGVPVGCFSTRRAPSCHSYMVYESAQFSAWAWCARCHNENFSDNGRQFANGSVKAEEKGLTHGQYFKSESPPRRCFPKQNLLQRVAHGRCVHNLFSWLREGTQQLNNVCYRSTNSFYIVGSITVSKVLCLL